MNVKKTSPGQLAIFDEQPAFDEILHVGRPNIGNSDRLINRINDALDRRWLSNEGPNVLEFEKKIEEITGAQHCIAMCNATIALEIAIRALEISGEVIIPSYTFIATAHALQWQQITPVFCDIDPQTYTIDANKVEALITPRTTAIIGVHTYGNICDIESLSEIADRHGLKLLFDAAHAFGCSHNGTMVGGFGKAEVFSFHATKFINTFEGGAVTTNDDELAKRLRLMKNFGFVGEDAVGYIGTNGKMNEISAAMGITAIESMEVFIETNRANYQNYKHGLQNLRGLSLLDYDDSGRNNFQYVVVDVDEDVVGLSRDELIAVLLAENVRARRYFYPGCHRMEPYKSLFPHAYLLLPETEALGKRVMLLPTGTAVDSETIATICTILDIAIENAATIRERLLDSPPPAYVDQYPRLSS